MRAEDVLKTGKFVALELTERMDFSEDLAVFRFACEERLDFTPGQYATLGLEDGSGDLILRPYSIASAPHEQELEFFIELVPQGALTPNLWPRQKGEKLVIRKRIVGRFVLDLHTGRSHHVMAATVTGVAPYVSMLRSYKRALDESGVEKAQRFLLIHGASRSWEIGTYRKELAELAGEGWVTYVPTVSRPWEDEKWAGEVGRVEDVLRKHMDTEGFDAGNAVGYACGHPQMIDKVTAIFGRAGFPKELIKEEKFF